jgi:hypothetical protein
VESWFVEIVNTTSPAAGFGARLVLHTMVVADAATAPPIVTVRADVDVATALVTATAEAETVAVHVSDAAALYSALFAEIVMVSPTTSAVVGTTMNVIKLGTVPAVLTSATAEVNAAEVAAPVV